MVTNPSLQQAHAFFKARRYPAKKTDILKHLVSRRTGGLKAFLAFDKDVETHPVFPAMHKLISKNSYLLNILDSKLGF